MMRKVVVHCSTGPARPVARVASDKAPPPPPAYCALLRGSRAPASRRRNRHCRPFIALAYGTDERESDGGTWEKELGVAGAQPTQDEQKSDAEVTGEATVDPEEDTEAEDDLALDAYAYDDENDNDLAASLFDLKTGTSVDEDTDDLEDYGGGAGGFSAASATGQAIGNQEEEEEDNEEGGSMEDDDEYSIEYLDPSDWRSLQLLAEAEDGATGQAGDLELMGGSDLAQDVLVEMRDSFLASNFLQEAASQHWRAQEQQASLAILPQFGTSTRRKRKSSKKKKEEEEERESDHQGEGKGVPEADLVHPARVSGTSEWYPETSERCLYYHERLAAAAGDGNGDDAVVVLEEMRVAGILPGPKAYHAAVHAYSKSGDLIGAANVLRKAFEMMVPAPLESALVVTRMALAREEDGQGSGSWGDFDSLLGAWSWLGYDTDAVANEALVAVLGGSGEGRGEEALRMFESRGNGPVRWNVNEKGLLEILENLCSREMERRAADLLQFELEKEELGMLGPFHLEPIIRSALERGGVVGATYQLKVCLLVVSPYLDFKRGLISLFHLVQEGGGALCELERLRDQHCVMADQDWHRKLADLQPEEGEPPREEESQSIS